MRVMATAAGLPGALAQGLSQCPGDVVGGEMGVACGGLNLGVAEELADHRQALAGGDRRGGEGMAQVVDSNVLIT